MDKVYLVGVDTQNDRQFERSMAELAELANACEMEVVGNCVQHTQINKAIYVLTGKTGADQRRSGRTAGRPAFI